MLFKNFVTKTYMMLAALATAAALMFNTVPVYAADSMDGSCSITVVLTDLGTTHYAVSKVTGSLYRIGDADVYGLAKIYDEYGGMDLPEEASKIQELIDYLEDSISKDSLVTEVSSSDGVIVFDGLDTGIYYISFSTTEKYGEIMPVIINLPYYGTDDGVVSGPDYHAYVEPKSSATGRHTTSSGGSGGSSGGSTSTGHTRSAGYQGDTPSDRNRGSVSTGDINSPGGQSSTDSEHVPGSTPEEGETSINPVNTGEETPVWVWLFCIAAALIAALLMTTKKIYKKGDSR